MDYLFMFYLTFIIKERIRDPINEKKGKIL